MRKQTSRFKKKERKTVLNNSAVDTQPRSESTLRNPIPSILKRKETDPKNNNIIKEIKIKKQAWEWWKKGRG